MQALFSVSRRIYPLLIPMSAEAGLMRTGVNASSHTVHADAHLPIVRVEHPQTIAASPTDIIYGEERIARCGSFRHTLLRIPTTNDTLLCFAMQ
jgi:hypothetical protein